MYTKEIIGYINEIRTIIPIDYVGFVYVSLQKTIEFACH